jgi:hypothetical protein
MRASALLAVIKCLIKDTALPLGTKAEFHYAVAVLIEFSGTKPPPPVVNFVCALS